MIKDFPIFDYPTKDVTDPDLVLGSLGSFWNQIFQDKEFIKGYTIGQAEEMAQRYLELVDSINSYSVKEVPVFHKEKWYPILIRRSTYNAIPLKFYQATGDTDPQRIVFGPQPTQSISENNFYEGVTFKFGFPKIPAADVYTFKPESELSNFTVLANRLTNPSWLSINQIDVRYIDGVMYFNQDIFNNSLIPKINLVSDQGELLYFVDYKNNRVNDQLMVIWAYNGEIDKNTIANSFGYLFELKLPSSEFYRDLLKSTVSMFVEGPTVSSLRSLACAFLGVSPVIELEETIENIFVSGSYRHIITDQHAYKFDSYYNLLPGIVIGAKLRAGDVFVDAAEYYDYVQSRDWWRKNLSPKVLRNNFAILDDTETIASITVLNNVRYIVTDKNQYSFSSSIALLPNVIVSAVMHKGDPLVANQSYPDMAFPSHLFIGNTTGQFILKNEYELVTKDGSGNITFPIHGSAEDVTAFHANLNQNKVAVAELLGLSTATSVSLNPLDFIFNNFFKYNTALVKFNFKTISQAQIFMSFFPVIKNILPKHVFFLFYFDFTLTQEVYDKLNDSGTYDVNVNPGPSINSDGSLSSNGQLPYPTGVPLHYKKADVKTEQFAMSRSLIWSNEEVVSGHGLLNPNTIHNIFLDATDPSPSANHGNVKSGTLLGTITPGNTNRDVPHLRLLNFT